MSHHCHKCIRICNPCKSICPPLCNPCGNSNIGTPTQGNFDLMESPQEISSQIWYQDGKKCQCNNCFKKHKHCKDKKSKRCKKCHHFDCDCIEYFSCLQTKCGSISACLTKSANPTFFTAAGQVITYTYTIFNTGTAPICGPIQICDNNLGVQVIPCVQISPGSSQSFTRTYTVLPSDVTTGFITNIATACIQVKKCKIVCTQPVSTTVTFGNGDVSGTLFQSATEVTGGNGVIVNVTISNSPTSLTPSFGVSLILPYPAGVTAGSISGVTGTAPASTPIVNPGNITIREQTIPIGTTRQYSFMYGPVSPGAYQWAGTITTTSFDPNLNNNSVSNLITITPTSGT